MHARPLTWLMIVLAAFAPAAAAAQTVQLHAGHLIDPGSGRVTHDRLLTIVDGRIANDQAWRGAARKGRLIDWSRMWVIPA